MSDAGSKYTIPTGPDYAGIYKASRYSVEIAIGASTHVDWDSSDTIEAVDEPDEAGLQLLPADAHDLAVIDECDVQPKGVGTIVYVHPPVTRALQGFEPDTDVRVYERSPTGFSIVPASDDPFVSTGGSDS